MIMGCNELKTFLEKYNPSTQMDICKDNNSTFFGGYPTLAELNAEWGCNSAIMWLVPQLYNLSEFCGCKEKLSAEAMQECAKLIVRNYYYLSISEMMMFFIKFKSGSYGQFYGAIDPIKILMSINTFTLYRGFAIECHDREMDRLERENESNNAISREEYYKSKNK